MNNKLTQAVLLLTVLTATVFPLGAEVLFVGDIYLQGTDPPELVFRYEADETVQGDRIILGNSYLNLDGSLAAREELTLEKGRMILHETRFFGPEEFSLLTRQGDQVLMEFRSPGKEKEKLVDFDETVVFGPTVERFFQKEWDALQAGQEREMLLPAPEFLRMVPFRAVRVEGTAYDGPGRMVVEVSAKSLLLRFLGAPNQYVLDEKTRRILEIHGPTLLPRWTGRKWELTKADIYIREN
jgi:hypothetical protein